MGLDIYFFANENDDRILALSEEDYEPDASIDIEVGYFRKVNTLIQWAESHIGPVKNCKKIPLMQAHLLALRRDLEALTPENCMTQFPTVSGFFFGSTAYDEMYWSDVDEIKGWLDTILNTFDFELNTLFFWAWW
ncbi:hypothetical protein LV777_04175 [Providencia rettgeri]|uniref:hypothetical protein n=1 Tax=Providencia rettgeri TaxID=587 RepID=UPI00206318DF|nr:hypothetical protein [Providencia rettgeri]UPQ40197.1 hypothetical protein LV777_04175 [Providencia rettgeri]